jgi:hypothetical protein
VADDSEKRDEEEHLELASAWVRAKALVSATSMKFLLALTIGVMAFAVQTYTTPKPSEIISVNRKPFEEAIARLEAINTQIKAAQASGPASDLIPIIEKAQPELQESIDGLRFSVRGTDPELGIALPSLVTTAYAAVTDTELVYSTDQRTILVTVIIIFIAVFWVFCFVLYFFSKDKEKVKFAATMIQTVLGFFIGIVTGMIGSPRR